jgi:hypothetical protein
MELWKKVIWKNKKKSGESPKLIWLELGKSSRKNGLVTIKFGRKERSFEAKNTEICGIVLRI